MKFVFLFSITLISSIQMIAPPAAFNNECPPSSQSPADPYRPLNEKICPSLDMRGHVANLSALEGCTVVEGVVHIVDMIETDDHFLNQTFPLLREITGYLLVYRVQGLRSIGQLFPNLVVIRGTQLCFNYSLVIYGNMQLQEIGLKSLTDLQYGSVMIESNPNLCHVKTIDWGGRIDPSGRRHDLIENNQADCPKCPDRCPADDKGNRLCWSNDHCQKVCDECSGGCNITHPPKPNNYCCHEECAGGCTGQERNQCRVCKHVLHRNHCYSECPTWYFQYLNRRCVTYSECTSLPPPMDRCDTVWKAFKDECILDCPSGYQEVRVRKNNGLSKSVCEPCTEYYSTANANEVSGIVIDDSKSNNGTITIGWSEPRNPHWIKFEFKLTDFNKAELKRECGGREDLIESDGTLVLSDLSPGNYCVQVRARTIIRPGPFFQERCFFIKGSLKTSTEHIPSFVDGGRIAGIIVGVICLVALSVGAYHYIWGNNIIFHSANPNYVTFERDRWEIPRENVKRGRQLNKGSFGIVYKGDVSINGLDEPFAIKTVNDNASKEEKDQLLHEASIMKELTASHVVKLLGVVSIDQPTLVVMELMTRGDLETYLRSCRPDYRTNVRGQAPTLKCKLKMAIEIANGMAYLAENKFVHRDLAARNCMLAGDFTVKIGDFGMARSFGEKGYYQKFEKEWQSVLWMPPESLQKSIFTEYSDVWSYGVVLWEMATLASEPYRGLSNDQVIKYVKDRGVMERPEGCPDCLYHLMEMCWGFLPEERTSFHEIIEYLLPYGACGGVLSKEAFFYSPLGQAAWKAQKEMNPSDDDDSSASLQEQRGELELEVIAGGSNSSSNHYLRQQHHFPSGEQILQMNDNRNGERDPVASGTEEGDDEKDETRAHADDRDEADDGEEDHLLVLHPNERQVYILVRKPGGNSTSNGNSGSRGDCSKGDNAAVATVPSDDSKGSYVSNGSSSGDNGYVMGILQQRRHNITEPL